MGESGSPKHFLGATAGAGKRENEFDGTTKVGSNVESWTEDGDGCGGGGEGEGKVEGVRESVSGNENVTCRREPGTSHAVPLQQLALTALETKA